MTLPYDIARCRGINIDGEWREGCEDCFRRTEPGSPDRQAYITPPKIIVFECEYRMDPPCRTKPAQKAAGLSGHRAKKDLSR